MGIFSKVLTSTEKLMGTALSYSSGSIGMRCPYNPTGFVVREQGVLDLFSGSSKILLDITGKIINISSEVKTIGNKLTLKSQHRTGLVLNNQVFSDKSTREQFLYKIKDLTLYGVIGPETYVTPETGQIVNVVPLLTLMQSSQILEDAPIKPKTFTDAIKEELKRDGTLVYHGILPALGKAVG